MVGTGRGSGDVASTVLFLLDLRGVSLEEDVSVCAVAIDPFPFPLVERRA